MVNMTECWQNASDIGTICSSPEKYMGLSHKAVGPMLKVSSHNCPIHSLYDDRFDFTPDLQDLVWIPKLAVFGLVGQTDGIMELNYGGSQLVFGKCDGLVKSFDMTVIQVYLRSCLFCYQTNPFLENLTLEEKHSKFCRHHLLSLPLGVLQA